MVELEYEPIPAEDEALAKQIIGAAIEVHRALGPGFIEGVYKGAVCHELGLRGIAYACEQPVLVPYKDALISGQRYDLLVGGRVLTELKAVSELIPIHEAQLLSYLKSLKLRLGLLINFNVRLLKDGIKRIVL